jgi:hypothetical protein
LFDCLSKIVWVATASQAKHLLCMTYQSEFFDFL